MTSEELWAQVISFEQHNPHVPDIRCQVITKVDERCGEQAHWAYVSQADNLGFHTLWPLCERHLREQRSGGDDE